MRVLLVVLGVVVAPLAGLGAEPTEVRLCEPWSSEYAGDDAQGEHVVGLWKFDAGAELADASPGGHDLELQGAKISLDGRFGSCLESFRGWPVEDERHRAAAPDHDDLSPPGAFTLELWIKPKPELDAEYPDSFLLDKKYVADDNYQLILGRPDRNGSRTLRTCLGFGRDSSTWHARPAKFEPGVWQHVAFTYDGAGTGRFFLNGLPWGSETIDGRKSISPGRHFLSIGDRIGSYYHGFPGFIDQVRVSRGVLEFRRAGFAMTSPRSCFLRMEADTIARFRVTNLRREPLEEAETSISLAGMGEKRTDVRQLAPGEAVEIDYPIDTRLRPDAYPLVAVLAVEGPKPYRSEESFTVRIVPRPTPRFPVLMWGVYGGVSKEAERLKRIGFTHVLGLGADYAKIFEAVRPTQAADDEKTAATRETLDEALADRLGVVASLSPGAAMRGREEFRRVDRNGKPYDREDICGLFPGLEEYCYNVGASVAQTYGQFPAFRAAMIHTEVRDHANPCFHAHDRAAFRQHAGFDIPPQVASRRGVDYEKLPDFPADRVIPEDHPLYVYYRWYWKTGDGWNGLNTAVDRGLKSTGRDDLWTYHDPAARVASVYGSGGRVDYLSQWTYSYPDPIRIGLATDELLAFAGGGPPGRQVMKMTQIIWYRSQTAPQAKKPGAGPPYQARWEREQPDAPFVTIAPMHLREAFWTKIARPIKGIMYHGWQSLVPCEAPASYRFTHPQTQHELARLVRQVVRPLGPTLLEVPPVESDVAFLESFASEMFAGRGTYGWGRGWGADAYHVMLYAHLQPEIVFDETIVDRGLDRFRVLVMPDCDVLTRPMAERIKAFQAGGGLVVGDERTCPAIKPDLVLPVYRRTGRADEDKAALVATAASLREELDGRYARYVDASDPNVIPYRRRYEETDYVFVANDRREFGQYVGHHGKVMEDGLPSEAVLTIRRPGGFVYDLVERRPVGAETKDGVLAFTTQLGPCDGRLYMIASRPVAGVAIQAPGEVERGGRAVCSIRAVDPEGQPLDAVVPVEVEVRDAEGREAEFSGSYAAVDGTLEIALDVAPNDPPGTWQITARELASGTSQVAYLRVTRPDPWPPAKPGT